MTWLNSCYAVLDGTDIIQLCTECLQLSETPIYSLPGDVVDRYQLEVEADDPFDAG